MPQSKAKPAPRPEVDEQEPAAPDLCVVCWPAGWPELAVTASCAHGDYERPDLADRQAAES